MECLNEDAKKNKKDRSCISGDRDIKSLSVPYCLILCRSLMDSVVMLIETLNNEYCIASRYLKIFVSINFRRHIIILQGFFLTCTIKKSVFIFLL